jgi:cytochrome P450
MRLAGRDVNRAVTQLYDRYGPIFAFGAGPLRFIWLVGPEANRFVLEDAAAHFKLGPAYSFLKPIGGATALISSDEPEHLRRRRLVQPAFHRARLAQLDALLEGRLNELFQSWAGRTVDLYSEV